MRRLTLLLAALLFAPAALRAQRCTAPDTLSPPPRTALALSGGGAKGLAHIGVLRTLDSLGIRPDLVVGTSMGAIVGALYASGYSAAEIDSIARTLPLDRLIHAYEPVALRSLDYLQPLVVWQQGERGFNLQPQSVRDPEMNALISALLLRGNLLARGDFDRLPIPFRAVATDLATRAPVVLSSGDLARAVRASFAIPLIFAPERIDGRVLGDGALSANVPVAAARAAGATRVIVSDITSGAADSLGLDAPLTLASHLIGFLFQQPLDSLTPDDVRIRSELRAFADLDFSPDNVTRLVDEGHRAANEVLRASACPAAPLPPPPPPPPPVPTHLARFTVSGGRRADVRVLRNLLGLATSDTIDVRRMQRLLLRLGESERYVGVWLTPRGSGDSVSLDLAVQGAPRRTAGVGLAYDQELGGRAWLGLVDRRLFGRNVEGSAVLRVGSLRQDLELGARREYLLGQLVRPIMTLDIANEDVRRFDADGNELDPSVVREASAFLGLERAIFGGWTSRFGARGIAWHDTSRVHGRAVGAVLRFFQVSRSGERLIDAGAEWNTEYARVAIDGAEPAQVGKLEIRPRVRIGWGRALPLQATFPLGGSDGFPGLHLGERRGDREAFASTLLTYPFVGPVLIRIELAGGSTAVEGTALPGRGWLFGARGGLGLDTPVGPVHADYGYNSLHRGAVVVRVGRWF